MTQTTGGLICPACRVDLVMSERQGVEIDYCPKCRGVWLDRGELDKILERSAAELGGRTETTSGDRRPDRPNRPYEKHDSDEYPAYGHPDHKYRKHRSFLHDLFD